VKSIVRSLLIATLVATPLFAQSAPETWVVDKSHSTATFKVRHMMANLVGQFRTFDGKINIDRANPGNSSVEFTIDAASIDTGNANRDQHLRNEDFFDVAKYPTITF
jgi:polyisoprenoid-binding protein YceI